MRLSKLLFAGASIIGVAVSAHAGCQPGSGSSVFLVTYVDGTPGGQSQDLLDCRIEPGDVVDFSILDIEKVVIARTAVAKARCRREEGSTGMLWWKKKRYRPYDSEAKSTVKLPIREALRIVYAFNNTPLPLASASQTFVAPTGGQLSAQELSPTDKNYFADTPPTASEREALLPEGKICPGAELISTPQITITPGKMPDLSVHVTVRRR